MKRCGSDSAHNIGTRHAHKIVDFPYLFAMWGASLAPDGQSFLFSGIEHSEGDIMLVEGFN
jgi:hypothetical protein